MKKQALIIDGNSLVYRAYYATESQLQYFKDKGLFPTNALKLMFMLVWKLRHQKQYDYLVIAFDAGKTTFRTEMFADYKAQRAKMPEDLVIQLPVIQDVVSYLGFNLFKQNNIEADDLIGSAAKKLANDNVNVDIFSSDKDILQLVDEHIHVHLIKKGLTETIINTIENFSDLNSGLLPYQIPEYKAIVGDKSDNIPGIRGVGEKTGLKLLKDFQNLDKIYLNLNSLTPKNQTLFLEQKNLVYLYKELATIKLDCFETESINIFEKKDIQLDQLNAIVEKYSLNSLRKYLK